MKHVKIVVLIISMFIGLKIYSQSSQFEIFMENGKAEFKKEFDKKRKKQNRKRKKRGDFKGDSKKVKILTFTPSHGDN